MPAFNTTGPCLPDRHYLVPPESRLPGARPLIDSGLYFVVHAPRQSGKSTAIWALARQLTEEGRYAALYFSCEAGEPALDDTDAAQGAVLDAIRIAARYDLPAELRPPPWPESEDLQRVYAGLTAWADACPRPLVLFFDEIDALRGESLRSVLRQLRAGFSRRPATFPHSVILCGLRDVRDYRVASGADPERLGTSSPFNVKVESLRVSDFTEAEVRELYAQHTLASGQPFDDDAIDAVFRYTQGQPWLVNALAREIVEVLAPPPARVTAAHVDRAKETLILKRQTHLDSLVARLYEPRVKRLIEPMLAGEVANIDVTYDDDVSYLRDLGLITLRPPIAVANPIYREVIARVLSSAAEDMVDPPKGRWVLPDGRLDLFGLLGGFIEFWTEHGDILASRLPYHEAAPQLVLMAWLQRVVNGGGFIDREYGIGRGRIDLLVRWPRGGEIDRFALELKIWADKRPDPLTKGLAQLDGYLAGLGLPEGVLVLFDRRAGAPEAAERTRWEEAKTPSGRPVRVLRA